MDDPIRKILKLLLSREACRMAFISWYVILFFLSSLPGEANPQHQIFFADKIAHFLYFAIGSTAFMLTLSQKPSKNHSPLFIFLACIFMASLVGVYDEWHQTFTPNRDGNSSGDLIANITGGAFGYLIGCWCTGKFIASTHHLASKR